MTTAASVDRDIRYRLFVRADGEDEPRPVGDQFAQSTALPPFEAAQLVLTQAMDALDILADSLPPSIEIYLLSVGDAQPLDEWTVVAAPEGGSAWRGEVVAGGQASAMFAAAWQMAGDLAGELVPEYRLEDRLECLRSVEIIGCDPLSDVVRAWLQRFGLDAAAALVADDEPKMSPLTP